MTIRTKQLNLTEDMVMAGGAIHLSDGSNSTPSLRFANHTNTGIYLASPGKIGFATSGTQRLTINTVAVETNLQVRLPAGSDISPAMSFSADTRSGWLYDTGKVALSLDGVRYWEAGTNGTITQYGDLNLTSHNITNAALINGIDIALHASRHLPNGADPLATASAVGLSLATANAGGTANSFARSDHTHALTGVQASSTELTALAALSSTGLVTRTAANTYAARSIAGTTNTITVSNGSGVSGNPTITLANNPVIPGTASLTLPIGTTAQRATTPVAGMVRYNSDLTVLEYYANTAWNQVELSKTWNFTGDATGSGNGTITLTLSNSGVAQGTYHNSSTQISPFTVDAKGRITSVGSAVTITPAWSSITNTPTTTAGYGITDAQAKSTDLTAIAALAGTTGFLKKTAAGTWALDTNTYLTGNQTITATGDVTGSGSTSIALTLANSGVTSGTYTNSATQHSSFTVDAKGRITSVGASVTITPAWSSITSVPADLTAIAGLAGTTGFLKKTAAGAWALDTSSYLTANQAITISGDATGSGTTSIALTLVNSGVTAGTYKSVTVDSKGRVTGGTNPTTLAGYGIIDALTGVSAGQGISVSGTTSPTVAIANNPVIPGTAAITLPTGTTAQRNASPIVGEMRYNTDLGQVEFFQAGGWWSPPTATARQVTFYADHFDNPYTSNWAISNIAPASQDATNSGLSIRAFDDTTEEGVGYMFTIPTGVTNMNLTFKARMSATQSTTRGVVMKLYRRSIGNGSAVSGWTSTSLSTMTFANNTNFQYFSQTYTLASLSLVAGTLYQFELTRTGTVSADTLTGDFNLIEYSVTFS